MLQVGQTTMIHPYVYIGLPRSKEPVDCMAIICDKLGLEEELVRSRKRTSELVHARFFYFFLCYNYYRIGVARIGNSFKLDHSTVIHGIKKHLDYCEVDSDYKQQFISVCRSINHEYAANIERRLKEVREHYDNLKRKDL